MISLQLWLKKHRCHTYTSNTQGHPAGKGGAATAHARRERSIATSAPVPYLRDAVCVHYLFFRHSEERSDEESIAQVRAGFEMDPSPLRASG